LFATTASERYQEGWGWFLRTSRTYTQSPEHGQQKQKPSATLYRKSFQQRALTERVLHSIDMSACVVGARLTLKRGISLASLRPACAVSRYCLCIAANLYLLPLCVQGALHSPRFARCPDMLLRYLSFVAVCLMGGGLARLASLGSPGARICCSILLFRRYVSNGATSHVSLRSARAVSRYVVHIFCRLSLCF